jgi:hypothetical protein
MTRMMLFEHFCYNEKSTEAQPNNAPPICVAIQLAHQATTMMCDQALRSLETDQGQVQQQ